MQNPAQVAAPAAVHCQRPEVLCGANVKNDTLEAHRQWTDQAFADSDDPRAIPLTGRRSYRAKIGGAA